VKMGGWQLGDVLAWGELLLGKKSPKISMGITCMNLGNVLSSVVWGQQLGYKLMTFQKMGGAKVSQGNTDEKCEG